MNSTLPKFRDDLTFSRQQSSKGTIFVVKDPVSEKYFYIGETERFIIKQCDGKTSMEVIQQRTETEFNASLPPETLRGFIKNSETAGLLETEDSKNKKRDKREKRIRGNFLYLRFKMFDPDELFNRMLPKVRFFFTAQFVAAAACLIFLASIILITNWSEFSLDISALIKLSSIPLLMVIMFPIISLHEFGHGLTCKYFGGEVHEIGFLLMYFQPAMYCNVSDAWLFTEKRKRLWVGFAGPFFELFIWALATLIWYVTSPGIWINTMALVVMGGSGVKTLFNFNPFFKLDGYYLLSDYLAIPNLRRKSFRYVGNLTKKLFGFESTNNENILPKEKRIFLIYGTVATAGSFMLLGYFIFAMSGSLIESGPIALLFASGLLSVRFRRRLSNLFGKGNGVLDEDEDIDFSATSSAKTEYTTTDAEQGTDVKTTQINKDKQSTSSKDNDPFRKTKSWLRKIKRFIRKRIKIIVILGAVIAVLFFVPMELKISGPFSILPVQYSDVRTKIEGVVQEIFVTEGDQVKQGDLLVRISANENITELQKIEAQILQARARLKLQETGPTKEMIAVARSTVEKAKAKLEFAHTRLERDKIQMASNLISEKEFESTQELAAVAKHELAEVENKLKVLLRGTRREEIEATRAEIAELEAQKIYLDGQIKRTEVRSPLDGIVVTPARQLHEMVGKVVTKGALITKIYNLKKLTIEIAVPEKEIADIKAGQTVAFKVRAYPDETFYGKVTSIAVTASSNSTSSGTTESPIPSLNGSGGVDKTVLVKSEINNNSKLLKPGMTGQAKVYCGEKQIIQLIIRRLARMVKVEFWSWW